MKRNSFVFYRSYKETLDSLDDKQRLNLYDAITQYALCGKKIKLPKLEKSIFNLIIPTLDSSITRYQIKVENGKKGGRPKTETKPNTKPNNNLTITETKPNNNLTITETKPNNNLTITETKPNTKPKNNLNYNYNDNYNVNYNDNYNDNLKQDKTKQVNRIEEKNNQVQSGPDKKIYFYEILTDKNKKLQEKNLEDSAIFNRLQNLFDQMSKENYFTTNLQPYKIEDVFEQMLNLFSGTDNEVIDRIIRIFDIIDNSHDVKHKFKYTIGVFFQQSKELFVNLPTTANKTKRKDTSTNFIHNNYTKQQLDALIQTDLSQAPC